MYTFTTVPWRTDHTHLDPGGEIPRIHIYVHGACAEMNPHWKTTKINSVEATYNYT